MDEGLGCSFAVPYGMSLGCAHTVSYSFDGGPAMALCPNCYLGKRHSGLKF